MNRTTLIGLLGCAAVPLSITCGARNAEQENSSGISVGNDGDTSSSKDETAVKCDFQEACMSPSVCHPQVGVCVQPGADCTKEEDCPGGYACDAGLERCIPGLIGTACLSDFACQLGSICDRGVCACSGFEQQQEAVRGALDIYFIFDRTTSMGRDCAYEYGASPPENSKACFATYAMADYLIDESPMVDTRLAFQFMSYPNSCDGTPYRTPLMPLTPLPLAADHQLVRAISDETFEEDWGTQIEGALNGIAHFTAHSRTAGREMIGVLMTDGDPTDHCTQDFAALAAIIDNHRRATGIRTFVIGMEGATEENLEQLAMAGGAEPHDDFCGELEPPCHYWNVANGDGEVLSSALRAIVGQAAPLPCEYALSRIEPGEDEMLDLSTLNVQLSQPSGTSLIVNVDRLSECPPDRAAWYYDNPSAPERVVLCPSTCDLVTQAEAGASMSIVGGCEKTLKIR